MDLDPKKTAAVFKAFCDENRVRILQKLSAGEQCACQLLDELEVTQPTLSHHMKILCDSGLVNGRKEGKWMHYSISKQGASNALNRLELLTKTEELQDKSCCQK